MVFRAGIIFLSVGVCWRATVQLGIWLGQAESISFRLRSDWRRTSIQRDSWSSEILERSRHRALYGLFLEVTWFAGRQWWRASDRVVWSSSDLPARISESGWNGLYDVAASETTKIGSRFFLGIKLVCGPDQRQRFLLDRHNDLSATFGGLENRQWSFQLSRAMKENLASSWNWPGPSLPVVYAIVGPRCEHNAPVATN